MRLAPPATACDRRSVRWRHFGDLCIAEMCVSAPPDLLSLAARCPDRYPFLLQSSAGAAAQSRFDLLLAFPGEAITAERPVQGTDFLATLDAVSARDNHPAVPGLCFIGGWFVYLGYEMAGHIEPSLVLPRVHEPVLPQALAVRCPAGLVFDRRTQCLQVVAENRERDRVEAMLGDLASANMVSDSAPLIARWQEQPPDDYIQRVICARALINAGDIFQANLARAWHGRLAQPQAPARVYAALRAANPAPFSGLLQWRGAALACSSPERLLLLDNGIAQTRPIAGTRPRTAGTDRDMTDALLAHPKERAEHVMLIDLMRNDLGRICCPGSITVDELMVTESYAHVHHIVSNVRGTLRAGVGPGAALRAVFPGGTITGCPKVRCMEIIAQLEGEGRGAYTGSFGYLSRCGRLDTNIIIRSLEQSGQRLTLRTGAGIVADSSPENELEETRVKARGVLRSFVDIQNAAYG